MTVRDLAVPPAVGTRSPPENGPPLLSERATIRKSELLRRTPADCPHSARISAFGNI
ncbi:hypothetical protein CLV63_12048 [Murinocardiopsis flavida]|uniref:Uncharacterized protein n=1 Tax=Murinocardiopsis flavida TaxID=645275 RepID=A0A2P8D279_9ACTN|nr:hypothetical protein CLV63_12048 [Murinocardiopsis flavida]